MKYGYTPDERQLMACAKTDEEGMFRMALDMYGRRKRYETLVFPEEKREPTYIGRAHDDDPPDELVVGPDEAAAGKVNAKELATGAETSVAMDDLISFLKLKAV